MNDIELTDAEATRLSELLHRAAGGVQPAEPMALTPARRPHHPGRWLAAAAVIAALVVGGVVLLGGDDGERVDTGPANTVDPRLTTVIEQSDIWRLPEGLDDLRLVGAGEMGASTPPVRYLVDDIEHPTRWVMLAGFGAPLPAASKAEVIDLGDGVHLSISDPEPDDTPGSFAMWIDQSTHYLSGMYVGVDRDQVVDLLSRTFADEATLADPDRLNDALAALEPIDGLVAPQWTPTTDGSIAGVQLTLMSEDDVEVLVSVGRTGLPPALAALNVRLSMLQLERLAATGGTDVGQTVTARPDLGPNVLQSSATYDGQPAGVGALSLVVITDDGTMITANRAVSADDIRTATPLSEAEQLRIIGSLRSMGADAFRTALDADRVVFFTSDSGAQPSGVTTTVIGD